MLLELSRPIAFIDVQSTGLDPRSARIVRLTVLKHSPNGESYSRTALVNPGGPIPPEATAIHGIADEDVADAPSFGAYARALAGHLEGVDLAGFGIERLGLPLLENEFRRAGVAFSREGRSIIDAMTIFHRMAPRDLSAAYARFTGGSLPEDRSGETLTEAVQAILEGELQAYADLPRDVARLSAYLNPPVENAVDPHGRFIWSGDGDAVVNFGRHRGRKLADVVMETPDYLEWVAGRADFPDEVRRIATDALRGKYPEHPG